MIKEKSGFIYKATGKRTVLLSISDLFVINIAMVSLLLKSMVKQLHTVLVITSKSNQQQSLSSARAGLPTTLMIGEVGTVLVIPEFHTSY